MSDKVLVERELLVRISDMLSDCRSELYEHSVSPHCKLDPTVNSPSLLRLDAMREQLTASISSQPHPVAAQSAPVVPEERDNPENMDGLVRKYARHAAWVFGNAQGLKYTPKNAAEAESFEPHGWVVHAIWSAFEDGKAYQAGRVNSRMRDYGIVLAAAPQPAARQEQGDELRRLREALDEIHNANMNGPVSENNAGCIKRIEQIAERALAGSPSRLPTYPHIIVGMPAALHPDTQDLLKRFTHALAIKLRAAEAKYGYSNGWKDSGWMDECREKLAEHMAKGDPRDVAAYCAFLWHHGESTASKLEA